MDNDTTAPHTTSMPQFTMPCITETLCTTRTPHNVTELPQRYAPFLQNYETQANNIMNPNTVGQANKVDEDLV